MRVLIPLPARDFDPTESAVPWRVLTAAGHEVVFSTPDGNPARADERMLSGRGLGPWRRLLRAADEAVAAYRQMDQSDAFRQPVDYDAIETLAYDAILLPGGHAPGMRPYLEAPKLQRAVMTHMAQDRPLGAICHGTVLLARSRDTSGRSALDGRRTTTLLASQELTAWLLTGLWLGRYYRTYPETVESEVRRAVGASGKVVRGPMPGLRDDPRHLERGFALRDGNYLSARWPGDAYAFSYAFLDLLTS